MSEAPEYHTKTLSPLSPLPVHIAEPSTIPVLQNQIDPIFNMTSTHIQPDPTGVLPETEKSGIYNEHTAGTGAQRTGTYEDVSSKDNTMIIPDGDEVPDSLAQTNAEKLTKSLSIPIAELPSPSTSNDSVSHGTEPVQTTHEISQTLSPSVDPNQTSPKHDQSRTHTYEQLVSGEVDIQALLDNITANAEKNEVTASTSLHTPKSATPTTTSFPQGLLPHSSLPPRPTIPSFPHGQQLSDIPRIGFRDAPAARSTLHTFMPPPGVPLVAAGAPGTSTEHRGGLPPPPSASFNQPASPINPVQHVRHTPDQEKMPQRSVDLNDPTNQKWPAAISKQYDDFLIVEQDHVRSGQWAEFPAESRMFIGNLASEKVTKRDIYHCFYQYGKIAQIAIKQGYAFVQFYDPRVCHRAIMGEQAKVVRGKKMELATAKPGKNTPQANQYRNTKKSSTPTGDSYVPNQHFAPRQDQYGRDIVNGNGNENGYQGSRRSPSPPRDNYRRREREDDSFSHTRRTSGDSYYPQRGRSRSRSPPPYDYRNNGRYRDRSPSPRRATQYDEPHRVAQLPPRDPNNVPDVQIIVMMQLDTNFVNWVMSELASRHLKVDVMTLSSREPLEDVIQRQLIEGVHAVSQLDLRSQSISQIPLQVFKRQAGSTDVQFDSYQDLDPKVAADVVLSVKSQSQQNYAPPQQQYQSQQQFVPPQQQPYQQPSAAINAPDLANAIGQMDNATLQKLLGSMSAPPPQNVPAVATNPSINLASILGQLLPQQAASQQPPQHYQTQPVVPPPAAYAANFSTLGAPQGSSPYSNGVPTQPPAPYSNATPVQAQPEQVQNILAQLARFRKA